jgi:hypothetical protein
LPKSSVSLCNNLSAQQFSCQPQRFSGDGHVVGPCDESSILSTRQSGHVICFV